MSVDFKCSNWAARKRVSDDQLGNYIEPNLLICDGLDHCDRNEVNKGDDQSQYKCLYWHLSWPDLNNYDTKRKHDGKYDEIPPIRNLAISAH